MKLLEKAFLLIILTALLAACAIGQNKAPHTVTDFYQLLPAEYITPLAEIKNRRQILKIEDIPHGYLRLETSPATPNWEGWAEIALFKKTDGSYLIGVVNGECATMCQSSVEFLEYKNGTWSKVTDDVMPEITNKMTLDRYRKVSKDANASEQDAPYVNYKLPRQGTTLILNSNNGGEDDNTKLFEFTWNGERFQVKD